MCRLRCFPENCSQFQTYYFVQDNKGDNSCIKAFKYFTCVIWKLHLKFLSLYSGIGHWELNVLITLFNVYLGIKEVWIFIFQKYWNHWFIFGKMNLEEWEQMMGINRNKWEYKVTTHSLGPEFTWIVSCKKRSDNSGVRVKSWGNS